MSFFSRNTFQQIYLLELFDLLVAEDFVCF